MDNNTPTYLPQATQATARADVARFARHAVLGALSASALNRLPRTGPFHLIQLTRMARNAALAYTAGAVFCTGVAAALYVDQCKRDQAVFGPPGPIGDPAGA